MKSNKLISFECILSTETENKAKTTHNEAQLHTIRWSSFGQKHLILTNINNTANFKTKFWKLKAHFRRYHPNHQWFYSNHEPRREKCTTENFKSMKFINFMLEWDAENETSNISIFFFSFVCFIVLAI